MLILFKVKYQYIRRDAIKKFYKGHSAIIYIFGLLNEINMTVLMLLMQDNMNSIQNIEGNSCIKNSCINDEDFAQFAFKIFELLKIRGNKLYYLLFKHINK
jgi:hypothetical protein